MQDLQSLCEIWCFFHTILIHVQAPEGCTGTCINELLQAELLSICGYNCPLKLYQSLLTFAFVH